MDPQIVRQRVEARLRRQQLLSRDSGPQYNVLLDENVIRRGVGNPELIAAQLDKVLETIHAGRAVVQVIPFSAGAYATADGYFVLLEFEGRADLWPVVYVEGLAGNQYLDRKGDIERYRECIDYLKVRALSPQESESLIAKARADYTGR